jgi:CBS domain-containing protein
MEQTCPSWAQVDPAVCARAQTLAPDESRVASVTPKDLAVERDRHTVLMNIVEISPSGRRALPGRFFERRYMKTAAQIVKSKLDQTVHAMGPTASAYEAVRLMADKNIGALLVVERDNVVGIVSERDYARRIVLMERSPKDTLLSAIMSSPVLYVNPDQTSEECMALMTENRLRHLPVMDRGRLIGLISIGDLVKATISEQRFTIEQLEHYISGQLD